MAKQLNRLVLWYGIPLSEVTMLKRYLAGDTSITPDLFEFIAPPVAPAGTIGVVIATGQFKTPGLRNTALTPPYFSYGGYATLDQVMEFYFRAGNARTMPNDGNTSGGGPGGDAVDDLVESIRNGNPINAGATNGGLIPLGDGRLVLDEGCVDEDPVTGVRDESQTCRGNRYARDAIVAFMKTLTDPRVQCDAAPFDHPMLIIKHGHRDNGRDRNAVFPAAGEDGYRGRMSYFCIPNSGDLFARGIPAPFEIGPWGTAVPHGFFAPGSAPGSALGPALG